MDHHQSGPALGGAGEEPDENRNLRLVLGERGADVENDQVTGYISIHSRPTHDAITAAEEPTTRRTASR